MPSLRQKISRLRATNREQLTQANSLNVQNIILNSRDAETGNWSALGADGSSYTVTKRGVNSGEGLELPSLTVKDGLGRFAN